MKQFLTILISTLIISGCASTANKVEDYCLSQSYVTGQWEKMVDKPKNAESMFYKLYTGKPSLDNYSQTWYSSELGQFLLCSAHKKSEPFWKDKPECYVTAILYDADSPDASVLAPDDGLICTK